TLVLKARIAQAEGDLPRASALLAPLRLGADYANALETQVYQAILESRPASVIAQLKEILAKPDQALGYYDGELRFWLGWAQEVAGDHAGARESWRQARSELEAFLNKQPDNYGLLGDLALTNMGSSHAYEVRPRKDPRGVDLISDALPFGRLWYAEPNAPDFVIKKLPPRTPTV